MHLILAQKWIKEWKIMEYEAISKEIIMPLLFETELCIIFFSFALVAANSYMREITIIRVIYMLSIPFFFFSFCWLLNSKRFLYAVPVIA
jgi:hypothetical protein